MNDDEQHECLKNKLIETYIRDYENIIPKEIIQKELDVWLDCI